MNWKNTKKDEVLLIKGAEKVKVRQCYDAIPRTLAKEMKKFKYSDVEKRATSRKFKESIKWLMDSNMAYICYNASLPILPLKAYEKEDEFKIYLNDTGFESKKALLKNELSGYVKGGIYENFVAETLIKNGYNIHYYKPNENMNLEFIIEKDGDIIPIEVKASNKPTKSLNRFIEKNKPHIAYKLISGNIGVIDNKIIMPSYLTFLI